MAIAMPNTFDRDPAADGTGGITRFCPSDRCAADPDAGVFITVVGICGGDGSTRGTEGTTGFGPILAAAVNSRASASADCGRSSRRFASARKTTTSTAGEMPRLMERSVGGCLLTCCITTAVDVDELKGSEPVSI